MNEFDFIKKYLNRNNSQQDVVLGIGDDAAIIRPQAGMDIHISSDMLVENRHFLSDVDPADLAHKVLAVNLSDMAAMGATPRWALLSVALPELNEAWLDRFCASFFQMADQYHLAIIGGDTTKGSSLTFNVTILGQTPQAMALKRSGARVGDDIWVSGQLGLAAAALYHVWGKLKLPEDLFSVCEQVRLRPTPRIALGQALLPVAHAAQDVSDGLGQDINHILSASGVGATVWLDALPTHSLLKNMDNGYLWALSGGDDYELVFTADKSARQTIQTLSEQLNLPLTRIGFVEQKQGLRLRDQDGRLIVPEKLGFDHFD